jgi:uncharacterized protein (TIGR02646 family)
MHKLDRSRAPAPACLATYTHPRHTWKDVTTASKAEIHVQLELIQGRRCAYCEGPLDSLGYHIEHFRRKRQHPTLTFTWSNLYWSCDQTDSCGHYKDNGAGAYNIADLIDPCVDDPDHFFRFRSDGTIVLRSGLSAAEQHRANETLRVFNLNPLHGRLRYMRQAALGRYIDLVDEDLEFSIEELHDLFNQELVEAVADPFYTAIRHVLTEP